MDAGTWCYNTFGTGTDNGWYPKGKFPDPVKCVTSATKPTSKPTTTTSTSTAIPRNNLHHGFSHTGTGHAVLGLGFFFAILFVVMLFRITTGKTEAAETARAAKRVARRAVKK